MSLTQKTAAGLLTALTLLAGCGVDGAPRAPEAKPGVSISGEARAGVVYNS